MKSDGGGGSAEREEKWPSAFKYTLGGSTLWSRKVTCAGSDKATLSGVEAPIGIHAQPAQSCIERDDALQRRNRFSTGDIVRKVYSQIQTLLFEILPLKGCVLHFSHHV